MKGSKYILPILLFVFFACEKEAEIDLPEIGGDLVVEGYIEQGIPPIIMITESTPFFSSVSLEAIEETFVHDAIVTVDNGTQIDTLQEFSSDTIRALISFIEDSLGIDIEIDGLDDLLAATENITVYVYTTPNLLGEIEGKYDLRIETQDGKIATATTTIPRPTPLDSIWTTPHPDPAQDTLVLLNARYTDVAGEANFIRYFTSRNREPFYPAYFNSVVNDNSIVNLDGQSFAFTMERGLDRNNLPDDFDDFGYFEKGDTIRVRWNAIDEAHYDFWSTLEFDRSQTGNPFSRPTEIKSNINGGLGIWGGYGSSMLVIETEE